MPARLLVLVIILSVHVLWMRRSSGLHFADLQFCTGTVMTSIDSQRPDASALTVSQVHNTATGLTGHCMPLAGCSACHRTDRVNGLLWRSRLDSHASFFPARLLQCPFRRGRAGRLLSPDSCLLRISNRQLTDFLFVAVVTCRL